MAGPREGVGRGRLGLWSGWKLSQRYVQRPRHQPLLSGAGCVGRLPAIRPICWAVDVFKGVLRWRGMAAVSPAETLGAWGQNDGTRARRQAGGGLSWG